MPILIGNITYTGTGTKSTTLTAMKNAICNFLEPYITSSPYSMVKNEISADYFKYYFGPDDEHCCIFVSKESNYVQIDLVYDDVHRGSTAVYVNPDGIIEGVEYSIKYRIFQGSNYFFFGFKTVNDSEYKGNILIANLINKNDGSSILGALGTPTGSLYPTMTSMSFTTENVTINSTEKNSISRTDGKTALSPIMFDIYESSNQLRWNCMLPGAYWASPTNVNAKVTASNGKTYASFGNIWLEV